MKTEKRLIDANAYPCNKCDKTYCYKNCNDFIEWFNNTVDAVEVVHGEWVVCGDGEYVPFMCSACGNTTSWYHAQTANYCPNCGATMDLK